MRAKRGEIQIFSTSFLDLLTCAMGAFLLLYFAQVLLSQQKDAQAQREIQTAQQEIQTAQQRIKEVVTYGTKLLTLKGEKKNVVFVFDFSSSMGQDAKNKSQTLTDICASEKWNTIKGYYKSWIMDYPCNQLNVIRFHEKVIPWRFNRNFTHKLEADEKYRALIVSDLIDTKECLLYGGTNTYAALKQAYEMHGVTQIILFTDGNPYVIEGHEDKDKNTPESIFALVKSHADKQIALNVIAVGPYTSGVNLGRKGEDDKENLVPLMDFLKELAEVGGGRCIGL